MVVASMGVLRFVRNRQVLAQLVVGRSTELLPVLPY